MGGLAMATNDAIMQKSYVVGMCTNAYAVEYFKYLSTDVRMQRILCLDPGETMGWCIFQNGLLQLCGQLGMLDVNEWHTTLTQFFGVASPTHCVIENYVVYAHKLKDHAWNSLFTSRLIGALELMCSARKIPKKFQMASEAKSFATDDKLRRWGLYQTAHRHANDSIRHGLYYMLATSNGREE